MDAGTDEMTEDGTVVPGGIPHHAGWADALEAAGVAFYRMAGPTVRFVTSFATTADDVAGVLGVLRGLRRSTEPVAGGV